MSNQQQHAELLTFGYVKHAYNGVIPMQLVKLTQLFYDDWIYWLLKDKKLKQFVNTKINDKIICSTSIDIKGIQIDIFSHPNGYTHDIYNFKGLVILVWKMKYAPTNIESFVCYLEIKCEALNCSIKRLFEVESVNNYKLAKQAIICQLSEIQNLNIICFNFMFDMKSIKYKKDCNKINYYSPSNKMHTHSKFTWNFNHLLLKRCQKMHWRQSVNSQNFDNNNWCLVLYPNGFNNKDVCEIYLQCINFPHNITSMDVKLQFDFNGEKTTECTKNFRPNCNEIGNGIMPWNKFKQMESFLLSVTLEITNIYKANDEIIEKKCWETMRIIVDDRNQK